MIVLVPLMANYRPKEQPLANVSKAHKVSINNLMMNDRNGG
jgi:hypothetical protein